MSAIAAEIPGVAAPFRGDLSWQDRALCAETGPENFFQEDKGGSSKTAKRVCAACEVRAECLEYALEMEKSDIYHVWGIWGGLSARERLAVIRDRESRTPPPAIRPQPPARPRLSLAPEPPAPALSERCEICGYMIGSIGHAAICGAAS